VKKHKREKFIQNFRVQFYIFIFYHSTVCLYTLWYCNRKYCNQTYIWLRAGNRSFSIHFIWTITASALLKNLRFLVRTQLTPHSFHGKLVFIFAFGFHTSITGPEDKLSSSLVFSNSLFFSEKKMMNHERKRTNHTVTVTTNKSSTCNLLLLLLF